MGLTTPLFGIDLSALDPFVAAGVLSFADLYVAEVVAHVTGDAGAEVALATALAVRGVRYGQVCVILDEIQTMVELDLPGEVALETLPWPEHARWLRLLRDSPAVRLENHYMPMSATPLVFDGTHLYLDRYWNYESSLCNRLLERLGAKSGLITPDDLDAFSRLFDQLFPSVVGAGEDLQRTAARLALTSRFSVIAGGPGTGKTRTVARIIAAATQISRTRERAFDIAVAAPTGKAAARMTEALCQQAEMLPDANSKAALLELPAQTIHRLLGSDTRGRFRHNAQNMLPHDLVIVDESSMVSLPLMASLLEALRPECTLVLVGDPFQLASVEAGAVLDGIVGSGDAEATADVRRQRIVLLYATHRFEERSSVGLLAEAVRTGDADQAIALLSAQAEGGVRWIQPHEEGALDELRAHVVHHAQEVCTQAKAGEVARALQTLTGWKVLCATRYGAFGGLQWTASIERELGEQVVPYGSSTKFYAGRPVIVLQNDYLNGLMNGDTGIVVRQSETLKIAFADEEGIRLLSPAQIEDVETWWAMTIHKSQGSEFSNVIVSLPERSSALLSRELLYTGITRAMESVTIIAAESVLREMIGRALHRPSGLHKRLWG